MTFLFANIQSWPARQEFGCKGCRKEYHCKCDCSQVEKLPDYCLGYVKSIREETAAVSLQNLKEKIQVAREKEGKKRLAEERQEGLKYLKEWDAELETRNCEEFLSTLDCDLFRKPFLVSQNLIKNSSYQILFWGLRQRPRLTLTIVWVGSFHHNCLLVLWLDNSIY